MNLTTVGLGPWTTSAIANHLDPDQEPLTTATIVRAVEMGVNWLGTAAVEGLGRAEELIAQTLRQLPPEDRPYVFTKCGLEADATSDDPFQFHQVGRADFIRQEVEDSLRRLGTDRLDLCQMHWPATDGTLLEDYWGTLVGLKAEGKVRAVGLSNHGVQQLEVAEAIAHVDAVEIGFSALNRGNAADIIPWCHAHSTGVLAYSPLERGLLSGAFSAVRAMALEPDDLRRRDPNFGEQLVAGLEVADALRAVGSRYDVGPAAVAVAWVLAFPGVTAAMVGARRPDRLDDWITAGNIVLDDEDMTVIATAIARAGAGQGPLQPE